MYHRSLISALTPLTLLASLELHAQRPTLATAVRSFIAVDSPIVALTHARVIDGTGTPPRDDQTLIIRDGRIAALGDSRSVAIPVGAQVVDLTGKTVIPGLVMVHEHLFYPTGPGVYANLAESFTRLYLAGGVTSMRTGGNLNGFGDIGIKHDIDAGKKPGPWLDATAPYLEGPGLGLDQVHELTGPDDARRMVNFWADAGATSFKAYMHITRAELGAAIEEAHKRGLKVTGHLCSVTYREAAALGIDDLEHGFFVATDFVTDKKPDECPVSREVYEDLAKMSPMDPRIAALIAQLVKRKVAITSTLAVFDAFTEEGFRRALTPAMLEAVSADTRARLLQAHISRNPAIWPALVKLEMAFERAFVQAGGLLMAGCDPTGNGAVLAGYGDWRDVELLVDAGFTPLEALKIHSLNGATWLGQQDRIGSIATGKDADLVVVDGDPSTNIADIEKVEIVFKQGIGFDSKKLVESVRGLAGMR